MQGDLVGTVRWSAVDFWEYNEHNIDGKGRLVLPSSFRESFEDGGVMTFMGSRVVIFEPAVWESRLRKMGASGNFTNREIDFVKSFVSVFTPDAQNRVTIPARLRERAGLEREVALIGMGDHIDVYDRAVWKSLEDEMAAATDLSDRLAEAL